MSVEEKIKQMLELPDEILAEAYDKVVKYGSEVSKKKVIAIKHTLTNDEDFLWDAKLYSFLESKLKPQTENKSPSRQDLFYWLEKQLPTAKLNLLKCNKYYPNDIISLILGALEEFNLPKEIQIENYHETKEWLKEQFEKMEKEKPQFPTREEAEIIFNEYACRIRLENYNYRHVFCRKGFMKCYNWLKERMGL